MQGFGEINALFSGFNGAQTPGDLIYKHYFILREQENNEFILWNKGNRCHLGNTSYMSSSFQGVSWNKGTMRGTMVFILGKQENKYQIFNLMGTREHSKDSVFGNREHKEIFF